MHSYYMKMAIELAKKGRYTTGPNPRVGCIIVKNNSVVGRGWHRYAGQNHAEIEALKDAGSRAIGATAYVTLEPCCHTGKTGPCTDALINSGIKRVVIGMIDPNPLVAGHGVLALRQAGISVTTNILTEESEELNPGFIKRMNHGLPYVRLKLASSLDGRTAMTNGDSKWITGKEARREVQLIRAQSQAVISGIGTLLDDDPSFNIRPEEFNLNNDNLDASIQPLRVILDSMLKTPANAKIFESGSKPLIICSCDPEDRPDLKHKAEIIQLPTKNNQIDLKRVLHILAERHCNEVLVESGATLAGSFLSEGLVDQLKLFVAPVFMGTATKALFNWDIARFEDRENLKITSITPVGHDWLITALPEINMN